MCQHSALLSLITGELPQNTIDVINSTISDIIEIVKEMGDDGHLVYHAEVWWLSRGRVIVRRGKSERDLCVVYRAIS